MLQFYSSGTILILSDLLLFSLVITFYRLDSEGFSMELQNMLQNNFKIICQNNLQLRINNFILER